MEKGLSARGADNLPGWNGDSLMQVFLKNLNRMWSRARKRARRLALRASRTFRRLSLRGKLVLGGGAALCFALAVTGAVLLARGGNAAAAESHGADGDTPAMLSLSQDGPNADSVISIDVTPAPTPPPTPTPVPTPTPTPDPTLKRGMESEAVRELQERLMRLGYLDLDESTLLYGSQTEAAVKLFQRQINFMPELGITLAEDGIAGLQTLGLIYGDDAPKYCIKFGMEGSDITAMQEQLRDLGYMSVVTGYYGETTVQAIKDFQDRNGLSVDGLAGEQTVSLLYSPDARESASKARQARTKANISKMISVAKEQLGDPYVRGARGPSSFDCSGLVYYCLNQAGSNRNRLNAAGYSRVSDWEKITDIDDLKKGDLVCFYDDDYTKVGHIGIVINSSGEMIDASSRNGKVVRRTYLSSYWRKHFYCGRRPW